MKPFEERINNFPLVFSEVSDAYDPHYFQECNTEINSR